MDVIQTHSATYGSLWKSTRRTLQTNLNLDSHPDVYSEKRTRRKSAADSTSQVDTNLFAVWQARWLHVFKAKSLSSDLMAGLTVAATALPLNIALAVACGLPPIAGLVSGAVGGGIAAFCGGSALQVSGPAAALSTMVVGIGSAFGYAGVTLSCLIVGIIQIGLGVMRAGRFISHVPESVLAGFTTGVGLKLIDGQVPKFLGLEGQFHDHLLAGDEWSWLHTISWHGVVCGLIVALCVISFRQWQKFPAALLGIAFVTAMSSFFSWDLNLVGTIPSQFPSPSIPGIDANLVFDLVIATLPLALLAAVESLISAKAVDRLGAVKPFHENLELVGQGLANFVTGFFSGMPVSGVIVRSSVNAQSGGKTRVSALFHAILLAVAVIYFSDSLSLIPLAALAGLLCVVGLRLVDFELFVQLLWKDKIGCLCFVLACIGTVSGHLMSGMVAGLLLHFVVMQIETKTKALSDSQKRALSDKERVEGLRAVVRPTDADVDPLFKAEKQVASSHWLLQIRQHAQIAASAFVHHRASLTGRIVLGNHVHIAAESSIRADEGSPFFIGDNSNVQDGVVMHALKDKWVQVAGEKWAIYVGQNVSMAHQALIHGPCYVGDGSFIGFKAVVHDAIVGSRCYVGIGAVVVGVEVPEGRYVPHGKIIDTQEAANALPEVTHQHLHFNDDVVEVNRGLAAAYHENKTVVQAAPGVSLRRTERSSNLKKNSLHL